MKTQCRQIGIFVVCSMILAVNAHAQRVGEGDAGRRRERAGEGRAGAPAERRAYVDEWLARIQDRDPDEYERLIALREEHPVAFRMEMRRRVHEGRMLRVIREEFPGFYEYLQSLDQDERDRLGNFLQRLADDRPEVGRRPPRSRFADFEDDLELRRLRRAWREADEEERAQLRRRIRNHVEQLFDERTQAQQGEVDQLEDQLRRLQTLLETRQSRRSDWIDQVLERLTALED